jgi:hypothetical protein
MTVIPGHQNLVDLPCSVELNRRFDAVSEHGRELPIAKHTRAKDNRDTRTRPIIGRDRFHLRDNPPVILVDLPLNEEDGPNREKEKPNEQTTRHG